MNQQKPVGTFSPKSNQTQTAASRALSRVGRFLHRRNLNIYDIATETRKGLKPKAVDVLLEAGGLKRKDLDWIVPARTLRHRREKAQLLTADESGRWFRVAKLLSLAIEVFGNEQLARDWLHKPRKRFEHLSAMEFMQTESGAQIVEETLTQIDAGFFA
jgi:putative toxin-antitoxin system antitoxin component (TIGR02293 family)